MSAHVVVEDITPEIAQVYLGLNVENNRNASSDRVDRLARDMRHGDWKFTADPIKFNTAGKLIDGQHRLRAIVKSGKTVPILVARNVEDDAVYVIDTGMARNAAQAMKIKGITISDPNSAVAGAQVIHAWDQGHLRNTESYVKAEHRLVPHESMDFIEVNYDAMERAVTVGRAVARAIPLPRSVIVAAHFILERLDPEACAEFFDAIVKGSSGRGDEDPIVLLTRRTFRDKMENRSIKVGQSLFYLFRVWNAWRTDEDISRLISSHRMGGAAIPIPR